MNFKKIIIAGLVATVFSTFVFGQNSSSHEIIKLTIDDAVKMAIQNNIQIEQSRMALDILEKKNKYSWSSVGPNLGSVNLSFTEPFADINGWSFSLSANISFSFTPALATSIKKAQLAYESGEVSYNDLIRTVEKSVRVSYYELLNAKESIISKQKSIDAAKRTYEANLQKYNRGSLDQLSFLNSQYAYESLLPDLNSTMYAYQNNIDNFKQSLGINFEDEVELVGSLEESIQFNLPESEINVEELPSIKKLQSEIVEAENNLKASKYTTYAPSLSLSYSQGYSSSVNPISGKRKSGLSNDNHSVTASVKIPIDGYLPWSDGGMTGTGKLGIESLENSLKIKKMSLEEEKKKARISIKNNINSINNSLLQLELLEANLKLSQQAYDMTLSQYNFGSKDLSNLQSARDNLSNTQFKIQTQKLQIIKAIMDLENTLGIPFGTLSQSK